MLTEFHKTISGRFNLSGGFYTLEDQQRGLEAASGEFVNTGIVLSSINAGTLVLLEFMVVIDLYCDN